MTQAQILAQFGDFTGYANLYGQEAADNMANVWKNENPGLAYNTGRITGGGIPEHYRLLSPGLHAARQRRRWLVWGLWRIWRRKRSDIRRICQRSSGQQFLRQRHHFSRLEQALNTARNLNNASPAKVNQALNAYMNSGAISEAEAQRIANSLRNNQNPRK